MALRDDALEFHRKSRGKIAIKSKVPCSTREDLSLAYTPGVAEPCREIAKDPGLVYDYTSKGNLVAVVTDGSAVLGLGDIGAAASMPVMEGKAILFKGFADVDAFPICIDSKDVSEIVETTKRIATVFGGINLEDISAPRCFEIEDRLKRELDIPVFHDDQHGTAVVTGAAMINGLKIVGKRFEDVAVVFSGAGAAGVAVSKFLMSFGVKDIVLCDSKGIIHSGRSDLNPSKMEMAKITNPRGKTGSLADAMGGADVFIGVSAPGIVTEEMVRSMATEPIVFAMANPVPEIMPDLAKEAGARVVATGRSDFPNQVNNVLGFPGIFRGALDVRASDINEEMKMAAARAIAELAEPISEEQIIPSPLDRRVVPKVAEAVARAAIESGVARVEVDPAEVGRKAAERIGLVE
jgi:malate dehydrogenase (oxaloacetate-decarboxylating)